MDGEGVLGPDLSFFFEGVFGGGRPFDCYGGGGLVLYVARPDFEWRDELDWLSDG